MLTFPSLWSIVTAIFLLETRKFRSFGCACELRQMLLKLRGLDKLMQYKSFWYCVERMNSLDVPQILNNHCAYWLVLRLFSVTFTQFYYDSSKNCDFFIKCFCIFGSSHSLNEGSCMQGKKKSCIRSKRQACTRVHINDCIYLWAVVGNKIEHHLSLGPLHRKLKDFLLNLPKG